jgi:hypothetical protein
VRLFGKPATLPEIVRGRSGGREVITGVVSKLPGDGTEERRARLGWRWAISAGASIKNQAGRRERTTSLPSQPPHARGDPCSIPER